MTRLTYLLIIISCLFTGDSLATSEQQGNTESLSLPYLIESMHVDKNKLTVVINKKLKSRFLTSDFFAEYDENINLEQLDPSLVIMPFLLNIIPVVWISGKTYLIDSLDADLYDALKKVKEVLKRTLPKTKWNGELKPLKLVKNSPMTPLRDSEKEIALLFSGGLDSTSSSFNHHDKKQLLITLWGQWDIPLNRSDVWKQRKKELQAFAKLHGHSNSFVRSNYAEFLNWNVLNDNVSKEITSWRVDTTEGMGMMGLAAPIMLLKGYSSLVIASSFTWDFPYATAANPFVDNNLLFAGSYTVSHDQFDCERIDKLRLIKRITEQLNCQKPLLKVCNGRRTTNCCGPRCTKCIPTLMGLLALQEDHQAYGFHLTNNDAVQRSKAFLKEKHDLDALWPLACIKKCLTEQSDARESIDQSVSWLLNSNIWKKVDTTPYAPCTKIDWTLMQDLCPEGVSLPAILETQQPQNNQQDSDQQACKVPKSSKKVHKRQACLIQEHPVQEHPVQEHNELQANHLQEQDALLLVQQAPVEKQASPLQDHSELQPGHMQEQDTLLLVQQAPQVQEHKEQLAPHVNKHNKIKKRRAPHVHKRTSNEQLALQEHEHNQNTLNEQPAERVQELNEQQTQAMMSHTDALQEQAYLVQEHKEQQPSHTQEQHTQLIELQVPAEKQDSPAQDHGEENKEQQTVLKQKRRKDSSVRTKEPALPKIELASLEQNLVQEQPTLLQRCTNVLKESWKKLKNIFNFTQE